MARTRGANALKLVKSDEPAVSTRGRIPSDPTGSFQNEIAVGGPEKPEAIAKHRTMNRAWDEIVPPLVKAGMLSPADGPVLELAIRHFACAIQASELVDGEGPTTIGQKGNEVKHPAEGVFRMHSETFLKYAQQFGLTFSSRMRTRVPEGEGHDSSGDNPFE